MDNNGNNQEQDRVLSLLRFSSKDQVRPDRAGIEGQRKVNEAGAKFHNVIIDEEFVAVDVSGRHVKDDETFQRLFQRLKEPHIKGVLVNEQSRIFRPDVDEGWSDYEILNQFVWNKKQIYLPGERIDPRTQSGRMTLTVNGMMSGEELKTLKDRMARGKRIKRERGKNPGGCVPRTVRYVKTRDHNGRVTDTRWELIPLEVERVLEAFHLLRQGYSYAQIAFKVGGFKSEQNVRRCLQNPIHVGIRRYEWESTGAEYKPKPGSKDQKPKRKVVKRAVPVDVPTREEIESGAREPIVPPILTWAQWDEAQQIMADRLFNWRKSKLKNDEKRVRFLLSGMGTCSCGQPLWTQQGSGGRHHLDRYKCKSRCRTRHLQRGPRPGCGMEIIHREDLDHAIEQMVRQLSDDQFIFRMTQAILNQHAEDESIANARKQAEAARKKLERGRENLINAMAAGDITHKEYQERLRRNGEQVRALEAVLPAPKAKLDPKAVAAQVAEVFCGFDVLAFEDKRSLLRKCFKSIIIDSTTRTIPSVTVRGGYLGAGTNPELSIKEKLVNSPFPDLTFNFPQPLAIPRLNEARVQ